MREIHNKIGKIIRDAREQKNMTQKDLSDKLGYDSPQFVSLFERGLSKVPIETLGKIAEILSIPERKLTDILLKNFEDELFSKFRRTKKQRAN